MTERGQELLDLYPDFLQKDPVTQAICNAEGEERVLIDAAVQTLQDTLFAATATENIHLWEIALGLPQNPGYTPEQRQQVVIAFLARAIITGSGVDWERIAGQILGVTWTYSVGGINNSQLTIEIPYSPESLQARVLEMLLRSITPATVTINVTYSEGFLLDISLLDDDLLG